jgi:hypothetical protein
MHSIGAAVEANWKSNGSWYPAKIATAYSDGTYKIRYDDGDTEDRVDGTRVRLKQVCTMHIIAMATGQLENIG